jgi:putative aminopeptidase FrvX
VSRLVAARGISEHETDVRAAVRKLLPPGVPHWVDAHGNLIARWGSGPTSRLFVAHMDEIGYRVTGAASDGRMRVEKKGGFYDWLYEGEIVRAGGADGPLGVVAPRPDYLARPRPSLDSPLGDQRRQVPAGYRAFGLADVRVDPCVSDSSVRARWLGRGVTVEKTVARLGPHRIAARSIDDRFGAAALAMALRRLAASGTAPRDRSVLFVWSVEEETGLVGAEKLARDLALSGRLPAVVHAVDTFVSSDTPLENPRYGHAALGRGAVVRAADTGSAAPADGVREVRAIAARARVPLQIGITSGSNDGVPFARWGVPNVPLAWPLRYSHSQVELADLRDLEALADLVNALARTVPGEWARTGGSAALP